ncbi:hypothetical protein PPL_11590 [Heterostelium album PN500]|uniref:Uncharacterized protein n=1 Tax=Heterostelium pallidum (strain ATCC 26659 / Pp 5 / PN500) TaxID=670386 RepID=D3BVJ9_HETP5|nr:hypothetical protein PPL_11590 [Heterostelium album PN500]EFA74622.1 hypothetical protein PPL_11590 [Heterostelium album PN500]|eukprot:XP_020426756.1 hypothetical protein PPL_11590 [Heterostelium album PN500]
MKTNMFNPENKDNYYEFNDKSVYICEKPNEIHLHLEKSSCFSLFGLEPRKYEYRKYDERLYYSYYSINKLKKMIEGYNCQYGKIGVEFKFEMTTCEGEKRYYTINIILNQSPEHPTQIEIVTPGEDVSKNNPTNEESINITDTTPLISNTPKGLWRY